MIRAYKIFFLTEYPDTTGHVVIVAKSKEEAIKIFKLSFAIKFYGNCKFMIQTLKTSPRGKEFIEEYYKIELARIKKLGKEEKPNDCTFIQQDEESPILYLYR